MQYIILISIFIFTSVSNAQINSNKLLETSACSVHNIAQTYCSNGYTSIGSTGDYASVTKCSDDKDITDTYRIGQYDDCLIYTHGINLLEYIKTYGNQPSVNTYTDPNTSKVMCVGKTNCMTYSTYCGSIQNCQVITDEVRRTHSPVQWTLTRLKACETLWCYGNDDYCYVNKSIPLPTNQGDGVYMCRSCNPANNTGCAGTTPYCLFETNSNQHKCVTCKDDSHCPGKKCINNQCVECTIDAHCGLNSKCNVSTNTCAKTECAINSCFGDSGQKICLSDKCALCTTDPSKCAAKTSCDVATGLCKSKPLNTNCIIGCGHKNKITARGFP